MREKVYKVQKKDCWRQFRREREEIRALENMIYEKKNLNNESCVTLARED